jgi:hypothetical protein
MSWQEERDELIAQTMAFVQSVNGGKTDTADFAAKLNAPAANTLTLTEVPLPLQRDLRPAPKAAPPIEAVNVVTPPPLPTFAPAVRPMAPGDMANEIRSRIANFRAHQERFNREREAYFSATLAKLRAAIDEIDQPPSGK